MNPLPLAYVVPTKDRPDDLRKLLRSIAAQSRAPDQVIVVDGSDPPIAPVLAEYAEVRVDYVRVFPPSLARQRNAGMAALRPEIAVAGYLDDDLVLEPQATERMAAFWAAAGTDTGGAAFAIRNQPTPHHAGWLAWFGMHDPHGPGRVLPSGFGVQIPAVERTIETDWLYGGATMWRRAVIDRVSYDDWYIGHGFLEDIDFSYRVRQSHRLFVVGDAGVHHYPTDIPDDRQFAFGRQQVFNRLYFVRKLGTFSRPRVAWALFGQMLLNLVSAARHRGGPALQRLRGNLVGLAAALGGRAESFEGHWKR